MCKPCTDPEVKKTTIPPVVASESWPTFSVLYFFAGALRKGDVRHWLSVACARQHLKLDMHEFDLLRPGSDSDLSLIAVQEAWMLRLQEFNAVVITPPCASYSRAQYANSNGPRPVRSAAYPLGFPWLSGADKSRAELGSNFAVFLWRVLFKISNSQYHWSGRTSRGPGKGEGQNSPGLPSFNLAIS